MIALPIYLQMVFEYNAMEAGLSLAPLSLSMFALAVLAGKRSGRRRPAVVIRAGFVLVTIGVLALIPLVPRADSGWYLVVPLIIAGSGLGLLVSQLNNYTLSPVSEERVSEAAGVNSAGGSFGLSFGLAFSGAIMLATLSFTFTNMAEDSKVLPPAEQQQVADALEDDAEILSNTQLEELFVDQPPDIRDEIVRINTDAREIAFQVALIVPLVAALLGLAISFRMVRLPGSRFVERSRRNGIRLTAPAVTALPEFSQVRLRAPRVPGRWRACLRRTRPATGDSATERCRRGP